MEDNMRDTGRGINSNLGKTQYPGGLYNEFPEVYWQQRAEELRRENLELKEYRLASKITNGIRFYAGLAFVISLVGMAFYVALNVYNLSSICS